MSSADSRKSKYGTIREQIRAEIQSRGYAPGHRLPSDAELADRFATSRLTVIRALRDLESGGLVRRRAGSGTFVAGPQAAASRVFGILMPDLADGEVFEPISRGIARAGEAAQQSILWGNLPATDREKEQYALELCRYFIAKKVTGVFFAPVEHSPNQHEINERITADLNAAGIKIVLIDRCIRAFPDRSHYDLVGIDNCRAGHRMTRHLLDSGCRRIAFAFRPGSAATVAARLAGFREAVWEHSGSAADVNRTFQSNACEPRELARFLKSARPDGLVCANDLTAASLMHSLLSLGVRVPQDVRMVGINDVKYARFLPVPLTTLRQPCQEIGFAAMTAMLQRLEKEDIPPRDILLD